MIPQLLAFISLSQYASFLQLNLLAALADEKLPVGNTWVPCVWGSISTSVLTFNQQTKGELK